MKKIVRKQSSARPACGMKVIRKRKGGASRGGRLSKTDKRTDKDKEFIVVKAHRNNQNKSVLAKMTIKEIRRLALNASGAARGRERRQLLTLGKLDRDASVKTEFNTRSRWEGRVPHDVPFTVEGLLRAMVVGQIEPLYDIHGKHTASEV